MRALLLWIFEVSLIFGFFLTRGGHFHGCHSFSFSSKSLVFSRDDDADDDECSQYQSLKSFVVFLFSVL